MIAITGTIGNGANGQMEAQVMLSGTDADFKQLIPDGAALSKVHLKEGALAVGVDVPILGEILARVEFAVKDG